MTSESYVHGASEVPFIGDTIGAHFDRMAERFGERDALIVRHQRVRWTYRELKEQVDAFAAGLVALGLERGDRIGIWSPNNAEWVVTQFATAKAGLVLVNINPAYRVTELEYALDKAGCVALITAAQFKSSDYLKMLREVVPRLPQLRHLIVIGEAVVSGMMRFDEIPGLAGPPARAHLAALEEELQFDDPINIQFTSGTTGFPKGATLSHHNILNNGFFIGEAMKLTENNRVCIPVPLYHCFGMVIGNLGCLTHGAAMVYPGEGFDPLDAGGARGRALHRGARRADDVHRRDGPPRVWQIRSVEPAHRRHGREPLPRSKSCGALLSACISTRSSSATA